ncbi:MAG: hypothetical protein GY847_05395 [Proteobacteria bacterium]|nr:hypothetical protein [Pseudomonadota bacterium]
MLYIELYIGNNGNNGKGNALMFRIQFSFHTRSPPHAGDMRRWTTKGEKQMPMLCFGLRFGKNAVFVFQQAVKESHRE